MEQTFANLYGTTKSELTPEELARAEALVSEKFGTPEWLHRVP
jgi:lipoate-protein ligase A